METLFQRNFSQNTTKIILSIKPVRKNGILQLPDVHPWIKSFVLSLGIHPSEKCCVLSHMVFVVIASKGAEISQFCGSEKVRCVTVVQEVIASHALHNDDVSNCTLIKRAQEE